MKQSFPYDTCWTRTSLLRNNKWRYYGLWNHYIHKFVGPIHDWHSMAQKPSKLFDREWLSQTGEPIRVFFFFFFHLFQLYYNEVISIIIVAAKVIIVHKPSHFWAHPTMTPKKIASLFGSTLNILIGEINLVISQWYRRWIGWNLLKWLNYLNIFSIFCIRRIYNKDIHLYIILTKHQVYRC